MVVGGVRFLGDKKKKGNIQFNNSSSRHGIFFSAQKKEKSRKTLCIAKPAYMFHRMTVGE